jgi:2-methylcitrate dehydratase PrpD
MTKDPAWALAEHIVSTSFAKLPAATRNATCNDSVALASTLDRGWHRTAAMGVFGAAAASGKLLGLTVEPMVNALGIAFSQAAGNRQCIVDGALTKRLQAGQAASSGVFAASLAAEGFTGAQNIFLGRFGFFELYQPNGHDAAKLLEGLGREFRGDELSFKPYACGRPQHAVFDAAIAAREQLGLESAANIAEIDEVSVRASPPTIADNFDGAPHKRKPTQIVEAQFALPYLIAAALIHGRVGLPRSPTSAIPMCWRLQRACRALLPTHRPAA